MIQKISACHVAGGATLVAKNSGISSLVGDVVALKYTSSFELLLVFGLLGILDNNKTEYTSNVDFLLGTFYFFNYL